MSRSRRSGAALGALLLLVYVLPLFSPPAAGTLAAPRPGDGFWQRVFPGVPAWWVVGRLCCLLAGALLLASQTRGRLPLTLDAPVRDGVPAPRRAARAEWLALVFAAGHAAAGLFAARFDRLAETVYVACLTIPAAVVAWGEAAGLRPRLRRWRRHALALLVVPLVWLAICLPVAWRSPRAANLVDMWVLIERLERVLHGEQRILADSAQPGHTNAYMMLEGAPLFGLDGFPMSFPALQTAHAIAAALCAAATGAAVWQMVGPTAAPVAQAALLFSAYGLSALYEPAPMFFTALCTSVQLLLIVLVRRFGSMAALVAFGAVAGLSSTDPPVVLVSLMLCGLMLVSLRRVRPYPWRALAVAIVSGSAAVTPSIPTPAMIREMAQQYTLGRAQLAAVVKILYGQASPDLDTVKTALTAGQAGALELPVGSLLAPFAIARTPLRIWGDVLFEPVAACFLAVGLVLAAWHVRRNGIAGFFLLLLLVGLIGGFTAEGDAVSHTRLAPALVPMALLTAVGFEAMRRRLAAAWSPLLVGATTAALVAASGFLLFVTVTPSIEPSSWQATSLEALGTDRRRADAAFLDYETPPWLFVEPMARLLPARPVPTLTAAELERGDLAAPTPPERVYFWSPALETDAGVTAMLCRRWPETQLYTLWDRPAVFHAHAATPRPGTWQPRLPPERFTVAPCPR